MPTYEEVETGIQHVQELEAFLHDFLPRLPEKELKDGEDLLPYVTRLDLHPPGFLEGSELTWEACDCKSPEPNGDDHRPLVLMRPGHPDAVGLTIKCVRWGSWKICVECCWIYCRVVLTHLRF